jgi:arginine repressor
LFWFKPYIEELEKKEIVATIGYDNTITLLIRGVRDEEELSKDNQKNIITL